MSDELKTKTLTEEQFWHMLGKRFCQKLGMDEFTAHKKANVLVESMQEDKP